MRYQRSSYHSREPGSGVRVCRVRAHTAAFLLARYITGDREVVTAHFCDIVPQPAVRMGIGPSLGSPIDSCYALGLLIAEVLTKTSIIAGQVEIGKCDPLSVDIRFVCARPRR